VSPHRLSVKRVRDPLEPRVRDLPDDLRALVLRTHEVIHEVNVERKAALARNDMDEAARLKDRKHELRDLAHVVIRERAMPPGWQEDLARIMRGRPAPGEHPPRRSS
jgi:hypothetical protein